MEKNLFVNFIADGPLKLSGTLKCLFPYLILFPPDSDWKQLHLYKKGVTRNSSLQAYTDACALIHMIETFDEQLYEIRTKDAYRLLADRTKSRQKPDFYPGLQELCPQAFMYSGAELKITQKDYISADNPFMYRAKSFLELSRLHEALPDAFHSISYIDPSCEKSGVYCEGPLSLQKGFEVSTDDNLTIAGIMNLYDSSLTISSKSSIWLMGLSLLAKGDIRIEAGKKIYSHNQISRNPEDHLKPDSMPDAHWNSLVIFWIKMGYLLIKQGT